MTAAITPMARNVALYPWFKFFQNLIFWQAVWFLFFQSTLSAAQAVLLYVIYDVATTVLEVPSGYMSDRLGRRKTLIAATVAGTLGAVLLCFGDGFAVFAVAQIVLGAAAAFASGTDSALLYESLNADGRGDEVEHFETRTWQFSLTALALSAFMGGWMAQVSFGMAFGAAACSMLVALAIACRFTEPAVRAGQGGKGGAGAQWALFKKAMGQPVLVWLFGLSVLMYGFSHVPFIFGQPFIAEALAARGWQAEAPVVSGSVTAVMMLVSVAASLVAVRLRQRVGLPALLLMAFGIQIGLICTLALTDSVLAVAVLVLRMVPNSWAQPFIIARIQPLLDDAARATFLSIQSFVGRLLFAGSLMVAAQVAPTGGEMAYDDIQITLTGFGVVGVVCFLLLAATVQRAKI